MFTFYPLGICYLTRQKDFADVIKYIEMKTLSWISYVGPT